MQITVDHRIIYGAAKYFASTDDTRFYLQGVFFEVCGNSGRLIATDGSILIAHEFAMPGGKHDYTSFIIPSDKILMHKVRSKVKSDFTIEFDGSGLMLNGETKCRPIDGSFPDFRRVIPKKWGAPVATRFAVPNSVAIEAFAKLVGATATVIPAGGDPAPVLFGRDDLFGLQIPKRDWHFTTTPVTAPAWVHQTLR